ncbi:ras GTPase-activating protein raskol-like [Condylostylus longicornis]|uniref:ras GTPase-activating protein raskol-like n=1 Tax=Condylostylus longicornis TaxID=2530218 RepID=UPI00244E4B33|nr:ras GTPase-activating protein raskol-like [Condylostylus longicornis]
MVCAFELEGETSTKLKNLPWGPLYCVLQQDESTFTAYCSEEISIFPATPNKEKELADILFTECPRVRLDRIRKPNKVIWNGPPTLEEEPEEYDEYPMDIGMNTTLGELGESKSKTLPRIHFDSSINDKSDNEGEFQFITNIDGKQGIFFLQIQFLNSSLYFKIIV